MTVVLLLAAFLAMCAAAVNSGFEVGVYSLSRVRLRYKLEENSRAAHALDNLLRKSDQLISGILVLQNVTVYFATGVVTSVLEAAEVRWAQAWSTVVLSVVFFIFVEAVPKNVFRRGADVLVYPLAGLYVRLLAILKPVVLLLRVVTLLAVRLGGGKAQDFDPFFTRERLAFYMREGHSEGVLSKYQVELADNILRGEHVTVARAMVPLADTALVPHDISYGDFMETARREGYSRYPVYRGESEKIIGVLNIYDCRVVQEGEAELADLVRPALFFEPEMHVIEALKVLRESRRPVGIVAHEDRALGIVTVKDCVEEIVGELYEW